MQVILTEAERKKIHAIQDSYKEEADRLQTAINDAKDTKERQSLQKKLQAVKDSEEAELNILYEQIERKRFKQIAQGGADAILKDAREEITQEIEGKHSFLSTMLGYEIENEKESLEKAGIGTVKNGKLLLNADHVAKDIKAKLYLHIEALKDNKDALTELHEAIIDAVEKSDLTDNAEIKDDHKPLRRQPLGDIASFGLMNDNASAQILHDGEIFKQEIDGQVRMFTRYNVDAGSGVSVFVALRYDGDNEELKKINRKMTAFDKQVYEAVSTRFYYWRLKNPQQPLYITPQEIWRTMNGKKSGGSKISNPSKAQIARIRASIDKMRHTDFRMDISAEIEAFNLSINDERITGGYIKDYLLDCKETVFFTEKGNAVQGYILRDDPILYTYNKIKNHLLYVPYEMLDTSDYISDSENVAEFKGYLMAQIQLMKNAAEETADKDKKKGKYFKRSNIILLETIYKGTGIQTPEERIEGKDYKTDGSRQKELRRFRQADRQKIEGLLDAWKAKGWIKGYTVLNQKNEPIKEKQQAKSYSIKI